MIFKKNVKNMAKRNGIGKFFFEGDILRKQDKES